MLNTKRTRRSPIGLQLAAGFACAAALLIAVSLVAVFQMRAMQRQSAVIEGAAAIDVAARDILTELLNEETAVRGYTATGNPLFLDRYRQGRTQLPIDLKTVSDARERYPELADLIDGATPNIGNINQFFEGEIQLIAAGKRPQAAAGLVSGKKMFGVYRKAAAKIPEQTALILARETASLSDIQRAAFWTIGAVSIVALFLCACLAFILSNKISRRLRVVTAALDGVVSNDFERMTHAYASLRDGDLTAEYSSAATPLAVGGSDEITDLTDTYNQLTAGLRACAAAFDATTVRLRGTMLGVLDSSAELTASSNQVSIATLESNSAIAQMSVSARSVADESRAQSDAVASATAALEEIGTAARQIAFGANDQARSVQLAHNAVDQLNRQIETVADLAVSLQSSAQNASRQAASGTEAVSKTTSAMNTMRDESTSVEHSVARLEDRSAAVGEIVSAIDDIADQTNLLALNAAIEAARAGEHGRGFAVVATEIRKLAERATQSTRQISEILTEIRRDSVNAAASMRAYGSTVESCLNLAGNAFGALERVTDAIAGTTEVAGRVADGSTAMRAASGQLASSMSDVSAVVEENAAAVTQMQQTTDGMTSAMAPIARAAEQNAAAAEELSTAAIELAAQTEEIAASSASVRNQVDDVARMMKAFKTGAGEPAIAGSARAALGAGGKPSTTIVVA